MRAVIVEDEKLASDHLQTLLQRMNREIEVLSVIPSVKEAILYFTRNEEPDIIFMDIQLQDGLSFEIFEIVEFGCPIIFTTAYDEYAIRAFKVNSIDYLLKPIDLEALQAAFLKLERITGLRQKMEQVSESLLKAPKQRFIVKVGEHIRSIPVSEIRYFFSRDKATFFRAEDGKNYLIDHPLDKVEPKLDPTQFFRVNRAYIISYDSIEDIISYTNSRLRIDLLDHHDDEVIVSRERVADFKKWLDR